MDKATSRHKIYLKNLVTKVQQRNSAAILQEKRESNNLIFISVSTTMFSLLHEFHGCWRFFINYKLKVLQIYFFGFPVKISFSYK